MSIRFSMRALDPSNRSGIDCGRLLRRASVVHVPTSKPRFVRIINAHHRAVDRCFPADNCRSTSLQRTRRAHQVSPMSGSARPHYGVKCSATSERSRISILRSRAEALKQRVGVVRRAPVGAPSRRTEPQQRNRTLKGARDSEELCGRVLRRLLAAVPGRPARLDVQRKCFDASIPIVR